MSWGAVIGAGVGLVGSMAGKKSAKKAAEATKPTPYGVSGPAGQMSVSGNQLTLTPGFNPFSNIFNALGAQSFANAATAQGQPMWGANPELVSAYQGTFGQGLTDRIAQQKSLLDQMAAPGEQRQTNALWDTLQSRGTAGTSGGAEMFRAMEEANSMADLARSQGAIGLGNAEAQNRWNAALGTIQQGMTGQQQNYNIGAGAFGGLQSILENLFRQGGMGIAAGGGQAPSAAMASAAAAGVPYQQVNEFLKTSGAYDAMGRGLGGLFGGGGGAPQSSLFGTPGTSQSFFSPASFNGSNGSSGWGL